MLYYIEKIFLYLSFFYLSWKGILVGMSIVNNSFVKNKKYFGFVVSGVMGEILAVIALFSYNYYLIFIALLLPFMFVRIFGGEPELKIKNMELNPYNSKGIIYKKTEKENCLSFSFLVVYALKAIHSVKNIEGITSHFKNKIIQISNHVNSEQDGHEEYTYKFSNDGTFFGELGFDFLTQNQEKCADLLLAHKNISKRLSNFRIQLFCQDKFLDGKLKRKYNSAKEYIAKIYGSPNDSPEEKEMSDELSRISGTNVYCWFFRSNGISYSINIYYHERVVDVLPWIGFSICEVFYN